MADHPTEREERAGEELTGKQRRFLRARGHHVTPAVHVGREGVSEPVVAALDEALYTHELVKVKLGQNADDDRRAVAEALATGTSAHIAQILGRTVLLYRKHPEKPRLKLP